LGHHSESFSAGLSLLGFIRRSTSEQHLHAVRTTSPRWFLTATPTPASPDCSTKEPSTLTFIQPSGGATHCVRCFRVSVTTGAGAQHTCFCPSHRPARPAVGSETGIHSCSARRIQNQLHLMDRIHELCCCVSSMPSRKS